jgi:hypothetical protein
VVSDIDIKVDIAGQDVISIVRLQCASIPDRRL